MTDQPIIVNADPTKDQIEAGLRQFIIAAGPLVTFLAATGWGQKIGLSSDWNVFVGAIGGIATVVTFIWGQIKTRTTSQKAAAMANMLPDAQAHVK